MLTTIRFARSLRFGAVLLALASAAACDDPIDVDDEPVVSTFRVTAVTPTGQTQTINVTANTQTPASVTLPSGTAITVEFLRPDGTIETIVNPLDFELRVQSVAGGVTFTRTGPFAGILNSATPGAKTVNLQLYHLGEGHAERDFNLNFTA